MNDEQEQRIAEMVAGANDIHLDPMYDAACVGMQMLAEGHDEKTTLNQMKKVIKEFDETPFLAHNLEQPFSVEFPDVVFSVKPMSPEESQRLLQQALEAGSSKKHLPGIINAEFVKNIPGLYAGILSKNDLSAMKALLPGGGFCPTEINQDPALERRRQAWFKAHPNLQDALKQMGDFINDLDKEGMDTHFYKPVAPQEGISSEPIDIDAVLSKIRQENMSMDKRLEAGFQPLTDSISSSRLTLGSLSQVSTLVVKQYEDDGEPSISYSLNIPNSYDALMVKYPDLIESLMMRFLQQRKDIAIGGEGVTVFEFHAFGEEPKYYIVTYKPRLKWDGVNIIANVKIVQGDIEQHPQLATYASQGWIGWLDHRTDEDVNPFGNHTATIFPSSEQIGNWNGRLMATDPGTNNYVLYHLMDLARFSTGFTPDKRTHLPTNYNYIRNVNVGTIGWLPDHHFTDPGDRKPSTLLQMKELGKLSKNFNPNAGKNHNRAKKQR